MRKKGQHFLLDMGIIERIVCYAELVPDDKVLEIGPGTGNLTKAMARRAGRVFALEVDPALAADLQERFGNTAGNSTAGNAATGNVTVIKGDALKADLPEYNKIVSNLPYQISSRITYRLLARPFDLAVLMYQREFALRMVAKPGSQEYGRLALTAGYLCDAEIMERVPRSAFRPVPEVESAIVRLRPKEHDIDAERFIGFAERLFNFRRKKVKKALASMGFSKEYLGMMDAALLEKRPEELTPDEAAKLAGNAC